MRLLFDYESEARPLTPRSLAARERLDVRQRDATAEASSTARCPRCGHSLVARMGRVPLFWCACHPRPGGGAGALRRKAA